MTPLNWAFESTLLDQQAAAVEASEHDLHQSIRQGLSKSQSREDLLLSFFSSK